MKKDIHPEYVPTEVTCSCGNHFDTGKQKILDTGGRVARFEARYGKKNK